MRTIGNLVALDQAGFLAIKSRIGIEKEVLRQIPKIPDAAYSNRTRKQLPELL